MQEEAMLNLKWDSFTSQLTNSLDVCYEKQFFVDLSLVCKNGTIFKCHKMILANASSFFRRLLIRNEHPHPMIILHDIEADDLKAIINFIYCGETKVVKSELTRILKIAEILEVSGLKDMRSKILAAETNPTSHEIPRTSSDTNLKSLGKTNMEVKTASTLSFARCLPITTKNFWNSGGRNSESGKVNEAHAKSQVNLTKKNENISHKMQFGTSGQITPNYHRAIGIKSHSPCGSEKFMKKRFHSDKPITRKKVLSQMSKETSTPHKRLCVGDELGIIAGKPTPVPLLPKGLTDNSAISKASIAIDPLDTTGVYIKQEIATDVCADDYNFNVTTMEKNDKAEQQTTSGAPSLEVFKADHCTSGIRTSNPKPVTLIKILKSKVSSG